MVGYDGFSKIKNNPKKIQVKRERIIEDEEDYQPYTL